MHVRQPEVAARVTVCQARVVEAQQMQDRRVQIMHMDLVLDGLVAEVIRRAVGHAALDAAAGENHGETPVVVVAAVAGFAVDQFDRGRAAELAADDDQRLVE